MRCHWVDCPHGANCVHAVDVVDDLDRIFPDTKDAELPVRRYVGERGPLVPADDAIARLSRNVPS